MWRKLFDGIMISDDSYVIFDEQVINALVSYRQNNVDDLEAGGLLLGCRRGKHYEIKNLTIPYEKDLRSRFEFRRLDKKHIKELQRINKKSKGRITYLGEWHTHPEDVPTPSFLDNTEWNKIRKNRNYKMIFFIIGRRDFYISYR